MDLNQITLPAKDLAACVRFYRRMGFSLIVDTPHYARFECPTGKATFSLQQTEEPFCNGATIYFEDACLDETVAALVEKGFVFDQLPTDMRWLWREAILHDPSGNKIKLYWAGVNRLDPPWKVDATEGISKGSEDAP